MNVVTGLDNTDYSRYRDGVDDYWKNLSYLSGRYDTERNFDYGQYRDGVSDYYSDLSYLANRYDSEYGKDWDSSQADVAAEGAAVVDAVASRDAQHRLQRDLQQAAQRLAAVPPLLLRAAQHLRARRDARYHARQAQRHGGRRHLLAHAKRALQRPALVHVGAEEHAGRAGREALGGKA